MADIQTRIKASGFARKEALDSDHRLLQEIKNSFDRCDILNAASKYREFRIYTYLDQNLGSITNKEYEALRIQSEDIIDSGSKKCEAEYKRFLSKP